MMIHAPPLAGYLLIKTYDDPRPSPSRQFAYKNFGC